MKPLPTGVRAFVRIVGTLIPPLIVAITYRMFWSLGKPMAVRPDAAGIHARARRNIVAIGSKRVQVYRWGDGPQLVLLVHGWRGRASQFAAIIGALQSPARTIVAFDAPGNGDSPGERTDLRDYVAAIREIAGTQEIELLVGHSFGVMAVFVAVREGVRAERIVSIAGISKISYTVEAFARAVNLPPRVDAALRKKIERKTFNGDTSIWRRFVSQLEPVDQTPLLIVHDRGDRAVDHSESEAIVSAHPGPTTVLYTAGLGHTRVLSAPAVLRGIVDFADEPVPASMTSPRTLRAAPAGESSTGRP